MGNEWVSSLFGEADFSREPMSCLAYSSRHSRYDFTRKVVVEHGVGAHHLLNGREGLCLCLPWSCLDQRSTLANETLLFCSRQGKFVDDEGPCQSLAFFGGVEGGI